MTVPGFRPVLPSKLRRLADALEAHENAARALWAAGRAGTDTQAMRDAFNSTKVEAQRLWRECFSDA